jgi:peroxiredoxin
MRWVWRLAGAAVGLVLAAGSAWGADVGKPAPTFTIYPFKQPKVTSEQLKGKVVLLNYWATWCTPCRAEMLAFDTYMQKHPSPDLVIFAIEKDHSLSGRQLELISGAAHFTIARDLSGHGYGIIRGAVPTSYVIGRDGVVRYAKAGSFNEESLAAVVGPLLAEAAPQTGPTTTVAAK